MTDRPSSGVARLLLVCHASTAATARAVFPGDEPLDENGLRRAAAAAPLGARPAVRGPELRCARTAEALGLRAEPDPLLADCDYGRWRGRTLDEVGAAEPEALATWLDDPAAAPHGGEPVTALLGRVSGWLAGLPPGRVVAVTHPAVIRAAVVHAAGAPARAFWRVDVAPLARVTLTGRGGRWRLSYTP
ncbi:broad specificity phosphatase PhoE [Streptosporangium becharense]|uniref:Broad specificity phosphatase PhoE n=1 Tax=Streptosporangium becharense TaxID=1816182 RepID=A0A7W9MEY7_9ACTN|nr:histidine phosphatase family protein [Streptosporangium becharense]MBB2913748.1 broad specificity phosphatase PhoE [Streptosporangium becharense]MBB5817829.1 broad specificity phosphatase PhoE [Streptosporangium becharense]